jgi:hypothetical protein
MQTISVMPADGGWRVSSDVIDNVMMFRRGKAAELAALRLAEASASTGRLTRLQIHLPDGAVASRLVCPATTSTLASVVEWRPADHESPRARSVGIVARKAHSSRPSNDA